MTIPLQFDRTFRPNSPSAANLSVVRYNGFNFPPALRSKATIEPVYDDSHRAVKYIRIHLSVSCFIFQGLNSDGGVFSGGFHKNKPDSVKGTSFTVDDDLDLLRAGLTEPGQELHFEAQGLGTVSVQTSDPNRADLDNGPKPEVTAWRPLTNKCAFIEWRCTATVPTCGQATNTHGITQMPFSVEFGINEAGLTTRTISGRCEIALARTPNPDSARAGQLEDYDYSDLRDFILGYFPLLPAYTRTQKYRITEDRKTIEFTFTDTQINSEEAYGEGCVNESVRLRVNNRQDFTTSVWNVSLSGSIEVAAGYPKRVYAMREMVRLLNYFLSVPLSQDFTVARLFAEESGDKKTVGTEGGLNVIGGTPKVNPRRLEIVDHIFDRRIDFSFDWWLSVTFDGLMAATGLFKPLRTPSEETSAWQLWSGSLGGFLNHGGKDNLPFRDNDDVIIGFCDPAPNPNPSGTLPNNDKTGSAQDFAPAATDSDARSYVMWEPHFELQIESDTVLHAPLGNYTAIQDPLGNSVSDTGFKPGAQSYASHGDIDATQQTAVHARREPVYILRFTGHGIRLNNPIPEPHVFQYAGQEVIEVGVKRLRPRFLGTATSIENGKQQKVFGLMWDKTYRLKSAPSRVDLTTITSDAHKELRS